MNEKIPSFLKRKDDALLFNGDGVFVFYVPEKYFETKNAVIVGEYVNIIGVLNYTIFDTKGEHNGLHNFKFPTVFLTKPNSIEKMKQAKLTESTPRGDYRALKYLKDDIIVVSIKVPKDVNNVEDFFNLFLRGNLPNTIPYDKLQDYILECAKLNGLSYGITPQLIGVVLASMCRSRHNERVPFRLTEMESMTDYELMNVRRIAKLNGAFSSILSENWDDALINAIMSDDKSSNKETPMEKILIN